MNCPKCGAEVSDKQKFCGHCGARLKDNEESLSTEQIISDNQNPQNTENESSEDYASINKFDDSDGMGEKIIAAIVWIVLIAGAVFGVMQYKQYQKDIEPIKIEGQHNNSVYNLSYDSQNKKIHINIVFNSVIIEQWQVDLYNQFKNNTIFNSSFSFGIFDKEGNNKLPPYMTLNNVKVEKGKPFAMEYIISNQNVKDFAKFKEDILVFFENKQGRYSVPSIFSNQKSERQKGKIKWTKIQKEIEAQKEAERKQKEWQEKVLSNCVYKTSDGVCFTTQVFNAEPVKIADTGGKDYDYWFGAKDACESKGYKLPSDDDLRSLFQDILGIKIKSGIEINTTKFIGTTDIPNNYNVAKAIAPKGFHSYGTKWDDITLWEDSEFDEERANIRRKNVNNLVGYDQTFQGMVKKRGYSWESYTSTICVYDPNGKPHKSIVQKQKEEEERAKKKQEIVRKETQKETRIQNNVINDFMY